MWKTDLENVHVHSQFLFKLVTVGCSSALVGHETRTISESLDTYLGSDQCTSFSSPLVFEYLQGISQGVLISCTYS